MAKTRAMTKVVHLEGKQSYFCWVNHSISIIIIHIRLIVIILFYECKILLLHMHDQHTFPTFDIFIYTLHEHSYDNLINPNNLNEKTKQKIQTLNISIVNKNNHNFSYSVKCNIEDNRSSTSSDDITRIRPKSTLKLAK